MDDELAAKITAEFRALRMAFVALARQFPEQAARAEAEIRQAGEENYLPDPRCTPQEQADLRRIATQLLSISDELANGIGLELAPRREAP